MLTPYLRAFIKGTLSTLVANGPLGKRTLLAFNLS